MEQQPIAPQSIPPPPVEPGSPYQLPRTNPGQTTGILGLIFAFIALAPIGLVLSIISTTKSSKAKASVALGVVGIILNALAIAVFIFFLLIIVASYSKFHDRSAETQSQSNALSVAKLAESYYEEHGNYPQTLADFNRYDSSRIDPSITVVTSGSLDNSEILYRPCGATGARVAYLTSSSTIPVSIYTGTGSKTTCP